MRLDYDAFALLVAIAIALALLVLYAVATRREALGLRPAYFSPAHNTPHA